MTGPVIEPVIITMQHEIPRTYPAKIDRLIDSLVEKHICVSTDFFEPELIQALYQELKQRSEGQQLDAARVGKDNQLNRIETIRGDTIQWLSGETAAQMQFLAIMEHYRQALNRHLFLGLNELEAHFAHYPPGMGYQRHLDSFQNNNLRRITIVVYLNPEWNEADGGQLQIFDGENVIEEVSPLGGTLVSFVSEEIPHQVAVTQQHRYSIAGWFRVRDDQPV